MSDLRAWLTRTPQPAYVVIERADGETRRVRIGVARSKWRDAENACASAIRAEAFNAADELLRDWEPEGTETAPSSVAKRDAGGMRQSEQLVFLREVAGFIAEASDRGAQRHAEAYAHAFEHQATLVTVISTRLQQLEAAWHKLLMSQTPPESGDDQNAPLVNLLLAAAAQGMGGNAAPAPEPPANGKGKS